MIDDVDYNGFPKVAKSMRSEAEELNNQVKELYDRLAEMKKDWYGPRYDELVKSFNRMIPDLNKIMELTVTKMPFTIEKIANNYAKVDTGKGITSAVETAAKKIAEVAESAKQRLRFNETKVNEDKQNMDTNLNRVLELMDSIENNYKTLEWESDASRTFEKTFKNLKNNIINNITDTKKQFKELMDKTLSDMKETENANKTE